MKADPLAVSQQVIHHRAALRVVEAASAKAEALGISICTAVVDSAGRLAAFARMPGAFLIAKDVAIAKAYSVAAIGVPAETVEQALAQEAPRVREGVLAVSGFTLIRGGVPLRADEALIGAVGVSGGTEAQDIACAEAGAAALSK